MPAIARSAVLLCLAGAFAFADPHDDVMEVLSKMAAALTDASSDGARNAGPNIAEFMSAVSKDMPDRDTLQNNITGLMNNAEVSASILPLMESEADHTYKIDLDWFLEIRSLEQDGPVVRRREVIHCELRQEDLHKKTAHWRVVALKPLDFFAPPPLGR